MKSNGSYTKFASRLLSMYLQQMSQIIGVTRRRINYIDLLYV